MLKMLDNDVVKKYGLISIILLNIKIQTYKNILLRAFERTTIKFSK